MIIETFEQFFIVYGPSIVAVFSMITSIIVSIRRVTKTTKSSLDECERLNTDLRWEMKKQSQAMRALVDENAELKKENAEIKRLLTKVKPSKKEE